MAVQDDKVATSVILGRAKRTHKGQVVRLETRLNMCCRSSRSCRSCHASDGLLPQASSHVLRVWPNKPNDQSQGKEIKLDHAVATSIV